MANYSGLSSGRSVAHGNRAHLCASTPSGGVMLRRKFRPKRLSEQTIVVTGASSGIGLATAEMAAQRGAAVVLSSRNEAELQRVVKQINGAGGRATYAVADVANPEELDGVAT